MGQHAPLLRSRPGTGPAEGHEIVHWALDRSEREVHELRALVGTISLLVEQSDDRPGSQRRLRAQVRAAIDAHREQRYARLRAQRARLGALRPQAEHAG